MNGRRSLQRAVGWTIRVVLPLVALALVALFVVHQCLLERSHFEDDRYNLGVVRHGLLPEARHLLETSLVHYQFEVYPLPRPEDWHRTTSLLLVALWARVVGPGETLLRLPHLAWVFCWLTLGVALLRRLESGDGDGGPPHGSRWWGWPALALPAVLALSPWGQVVLRRAFVDDVPAGACALVAVLVLVGSGVTVRAASASGALLGLAFTLKDMYLVWGPLGVVVLLLLSRDGPTRVPTRTLALAVVGFAVAFAVPVGAKLLWSRAETGAFLPNPSPHYWRALYYGQPPVDGHYPFHLFDDDSYRSRLELAGGTLEVIAKTVRGPVRQLVSAHDTLLFAWIWLVPALIAARQGWSVVRHRLLVVLLAAVGGYSAAFAAGYGEAIHLRYWLLPVTLAVALGVDGSARLARSALERGHDVRRLMLGGAVALVFLAVLASRLVAVGAVKLTPDVPPHSEVAMDMVAARLDSRSAVLLELWGGMDYWSLHPGSRVVAFPVHHLAALRPHEVRRLVETYDVRLTLLSEPAAIEAVRRAGFETVARTSLGEELLAAPPRDAR